MLVSGGHLIVSHGGRMAQSCSATLEALALAQNALYKFKELEAFRHKILVY